MSKNAYSVLLYDDNIAQISRQVRICLSRVRSVACHEIYSSGLFISECSYPQMRRPPNNRLNHIAMTKLLPHSFHPLHEVRALYAYLLIW